jgi:hypothetical protein
MLSRRPFVRPHARCLQTLVRWAHDTRGVSAIEVAIALPVIILVTLSCVELGLDLWVDATVETAIQRASRIGITAVPPQGKTLQQAVQDSIADTLSPWAGRNPIIVIATKSYPSYAAVGQGEPYVDVGKVGHYVQGDPFTDVNKNGVYDSDLGVNGTGGFNDIVKYNISIKMDDFTGLPSSIGISNLVFNRTFIVQNETLQNASQ